MRDTWTAAEERQGPRCFRPRRQASDGRDRPHQRFRCNPSLRSSRQGQGPQPALPLLDGVLRHEEPPRDGERRRVPSRAPALQGRPSRPLHARQEGQDGRGRVHRPRLPHGLWLEGIPEVRNRQRHEAARGLRERFEARRSPLHPDDEGRHRRPRRGDQLRRDRPARRRKDCDASSRHDSLALLEGGGLRARARHHHRRHEVRVRP